jgi:hypothetical protein
MGFGSKKLDNAYDRWVTESLAESPEDYFEDDDSDFNDESDENEDNKDIE